LFTIGINDHIFQAQGFGAFLHQRQGIPAQYGSSIERMLDRLDASKEAKDMDLPGYKFHAMKGDRKSEFAVSVTGNWRITYQFVGEDAMNVNLEDYH